MLFNIFYLYAIAWSVILLLYAFQWSDLCIPLSTPVLLFVLFTIAIAVVLGYLYRNKLKFYKLKKNPHKPLVTLFFLLFYIADFSCARYVPLFAVMAGYSHTSQDFHGVPWLHVLMMGVSILYAFYLVYLYACFKKKSLVWEFLLIFLYFLLMYQRQNMLILLLGAAWILFASVDFKKIEKSTLLWICGNGIFFAFFVLFFFGVIGNTRYGSEWGWRDSSMILELGKINDKWPAFLPHNFAWAYVYLVSPLSNLQCNYLAGVQAGASLLDAAWEFLPRYLTNFFPYSSGIHLELLEPSLFVCTAFAAIYRAMGMGGMYLLYFVEIALLVVVIEIVRRNKKLFVPFSVGLFYFFMMNFFDNPMVYEITSFMCLYPVLYVFFAFLKKKAIWCYEQLTDSTPITTAKKTVGSKASTDAETKEKGTTKKS